MIIAADTWVVIVSIFFRISSFSYLVEISINSYSFSIFSFFLKIILLDLNKQCKTGNIDDFAQSKKLDDSEIFAPFSLLCHDLSSLDIEIG